MGEIWSTQVKIYTSTALVFCLNTYNIYRSYKTPVVIKGILGPNFGKNLYFGGLGWGTQNK